MLGRRDLTWCGNSLYRWGSREPIAEVAPDAKWPGMWRFRLLPDGSLSDMVNLSRARDAAAERAINVANKHRRSAQGASPMRRNLEDVLDVLPEPERLPAPLSPSAGATGPAGPLYPTTPD